MSWFDATGISALAKNALKEAQKQIDKVLDIKENEDDDVLITSTAVEKTTIKSGSKTEPSTPLNPPEKPDSSVWGSFTGSFFDHPTDEVNVLVTKAPSSLKRKSLEDSAYIEKSSRHSNVSNEDISSSQSIELLSPPTTPGSALTSPNQGSSSTILSESVEVIHVHSTPSLISSPESITTLEDEEESKPFNPIIGVHPVATPDEDDISIEDDSMSYTISEQPTVAENIPITTAPSRSSLHLSLEKSNTSRMTFSEGSVCDTEESNDSEQTTVQLDKSYESVEIQTQISDSTHSFEEIQASSVEGQSHTQMSSNQEHHSSGDENETTTSSDIEIISSPNGDSSSTNSGAYRASPLKISDGKSNIDLIMIKKRGHNRELSEASNISDDSHLSNHSETEKLLRRINELSEILEQREYRLMELGRQNAELNEMNGNILSQLELKQKSVPTDVADEYTQRLSALEKKFQQSIREKETLRTQIETLKSDSQNKMSKPEVDKVIAEKDFLIEELKTEGEKLSKQVLQHSNIIKKLRQKEKEYETSTKQMKEEIQELNEETERLKRSLSAKEEVERSQIANIHKLSSERRKLEKENNQLKSTLDDNSQKLETLKKSFEAAKKELTEKNESHFELVKKSNQLTNIESENLKLQLESQQLATQLDDLREKLKMTEMEYSVRLQKMKNENSELTRRIEETEMRSEDEKNAASLVTIPLMRQLDALQSTLRNKERFWEDQERTLSVKLEQATEKSKSFIENDRNLREQISNFNLRISDLEQRLTGALFKGEELTNTLQQQQIDFELQENDYKKRIKLLEKDREATKELVGTFRDKVLQLEDKLKLQKEQFEDVRRQQEAKVEAAENSMLNESRESSPTSMGNLSLPDSLASITWNNDDVDCISNSGRTTLGGLHSTSMMETLQSSLKQRDGEVYQLQWELSRFQSERNVLTEEVTKLTLELEVIKEKLEKNAKLEEQFGELQQQYDALLQMYGEKVEETQELQLDLQDVKDMYKLQIDELLRQQRRENL